MIINTCSKIGVVPFNSAFSLISLHAAISSDNSKGFDSKESTSDDKLNGSSLVAPSLEDNTCYSIQTTHNYRLYLMYMFDCIY